MHNRFRVSIEPWLKLSITPPTLFIIIFNKLLGLRKMEIITYMKSVWKGVLFSSITEYDMEIMLWNQISWQFNLS